MIITVVGARGPRGERGSPLIIDEGVGARGRSPSAAIWPASGSRVPAGALEQPIYATEAQWAMLKSPQAPVAQDAAAASALVSNRVSACLAVALRAAEGEDLLRDLAGPVLGPGDSAGECGFKALTSSDPAAKIKELAAEIVFGRLVMRALIGMFFLECLTDLVRDDRALYDAASVRRRGAHGRQGCRN
jgi:hypothetical protein